MVYPERMVIAVDALPVNLVGNTIPSLQSRLFSRLMYGQLAALNDATGQIEPEHLESMTLVDDTTVEIKLKKNIVFHNGEKFDANSLKKTFDIVSNLDPSKITWKFTGFKDYEDTGTVIDDYTMRFKLTAPIDRWASAFTFMPLAPAIWRKSVLMATLMIQLIRARTSTSNGNEIVIFGLHVGVLNNGSYVLG